MALAASLPHLSAFRCAAAAWWIVSLGPPPLGKDLEFSTRVVDRDGRLLRAYATSDGRWRLPATVADVDPRFFDVLFAYEDKRFRTHHGVDPLALMRAALQLATSGRILSGGSTLTMQVARLLEPRSERRFSAKLRQIVRAVEIERVLTKDEVLSLYLDLAPYGGNIEGIRAASLAYFGKEPRRLTLGEAALLVALPQSPELRRPDRFGRGRAHRPKPRARPIRRDRPACRPTRSRSPRPNRCPPARHPMPMLAPHAADRAIAETPASKRDSAHHRRRSAEESGGAGARARRARWRRRWDRIFRSPLLAVDNATGEVLAHVGSPAYFDERRAGAGGHDAGAALARLDAQAVHLRSRLRGRLHPPGDADRRSAGALRRLCAAEFQFQLRGYGHGAPGAAAIAQHAGRRRARPGRRKPAHRTARRRPAPRWCCPRAKRPVLPSGLAESEQNSPIW